MGVGVGLGGYDGFGSDGWIDRSGWRDRGDGVGGRLSGSYNRFGQGICSCVCVFIFFASVRLSVDGLDDRAATRVTLRKKM